MERIYKIVNAIPYKAITPTKTIIPIFCFTTVIIINKRVSRTAITKFLYILEIAVTMIFKHSTTNTRYIIKLEYWLVKIVITTI